MIASGQARKRQTMRRWYIRAGGVATAVLIGVLAVAPTASAQPTAARGWTPPPGLAGVTVPGNFPGQTRAHHVSFTINGSRPGPAFQGVGAISGGGGNSRLLIDYPKAQRQQILDYLFKPGYGADLQILKLEIGGDAYATDGSEPSIEHAKGAINCGAGYELWLAKQATALNPKLQLYALQWNAPRWVGGAWSDADIGYIIDWLHCATKDGLHISYLGGWNEHLPHGITTKVMGWFVRLRSTLNRTGYRRVRIVAVDSFAHEDGTDVSNYLASHPAFRKAVSVLGYHNLCKYPATGKICLVPAAARASGKEIWESEIGALRQGTGVAAMTRSIDNAFIQVGATGLIAWPLMDSMPAYLPEEDRGLIFADQPWNGQYKVNLMTWVIAQTTQFTQPGWRHILGAAGQFGGAYGSYNTYEAPDHSGWTLNVQTTDAPAAQTISVHVDRGLPRSMVHVWSTNVRSGRSGSWFVQHINVHPANGGFSYVLQPGFIYTFTTTTGQGKGRKISPSSGPMPLPYTAKPDMSNEPKDLGAQDASFEYLPDGQTIEQTTVGAPVFWQNPSRFRFPYAVVGNNGWSNYEVSAFVSFTAAGQSAGLISRFSHPKANGVAQRFNGYQFVVTESGAWSLLSNRVGKPPIVLKTGKLSAPVGVATPTKLSLSAHGAQIVAMISGNVVASVANRSYQAGDAGISTGGWYPVQFTNLMVTG